MMISKFKYLLPALALLAVSCGGSENQKTDPVEEVPGPALVSTDPADGTGGLTGSSLSITFTYDQNILCTAQTLSAIQADNGAIISEARADGAKLTVTVGGLSRGVSYTVSIPAGAVKGYKQNQKASAAVAFHFTMKEPDPVEPDSWETAAEAVRNMGVGWNLGNTLESNSGDVENMWIESSNTAYEEAWGQTAATRELIHMFKDAGFNAIRVPVTWYPHMGNFKATIYGTHWEKSAWLESTDYQVDPAWMARVKEVVGYVLDEGMYCILNVHHDTGTATTAWLRADQSVYTAVRDRYCSLWTQIATAFESYGPKLLFESFNEMLDATNTWNYVSAEADGVINAYNADFVATVRATGGNNAKRNLVLNTYAASPDERAVKDFALPQDSVEGHLMAEVHSYAPYNFAFDTQWPQEVFDANCDREVRSIMDGLGKNLVAKGIPCILGEYGADTGKRAEAELAKQAACYVSQGAKYNIACFYWMGLSDGKEDRAAPRWTKPALKDAILQAYNDSKNN
jgi:endoglucanase